MAGVKMSDATQLAHALIHGVSAQRGIRVVSIKGPTADYYALRPTHVAADADVYCEPDRVDELCAALAEVGFRERPGTVMSRRIPAHSHTLLHQKWPCDLDVHFVIPGFMVASQRAFDVVWSHRVVSSLADVQGWMTDKSTAVLVQALHSLRNPAQTPRHRAEYMELVGRVLPELSESESLALLDRASQLGALDTARPLLERLPVELPRATPAGVDPALDEWRQRVASRATRTAVAAVVWHDVALRDRLAFLVTAVWPSEKDLRIERPEIGPGAMNLAKARCRRVLRGILAVPQIVRGRRMRRLGVTDDSWLT